MRFNVRRIAHGIGTITRAVTNQLPRIPSGGSSSPKKPQGGTGPKAIRPAKPTPNSRHQALTTEQRRLKRVLRPRSNTKVRVIK